jgi:hypothetical protein
MLAAATVSPFFCSSATRCFFMVSYVARTSRGMSTHSMKSGPSFSSGTSGISLSGIVIDTVLIASIRPRSFSGCTRHE